jgi:hypothetical protein
VRRLGGGVDHELDLRSVLAEEPVERVDVADVDVGRLERRNLAPQALELRRSRRLWAEEPRPHVVFDPDDVVAGTAEVPNCRRPDETPCTRDDCDCHPGARLSPDGASLAA